MQRSDPGIVSARGIETPPNYRLCTGIWVACRGVFVHKCAIDEETAIMPGLENEPPTPEELFPDVRKLLTAYKGRISHLCAVIRP